jgi:hypothetical protein
LFSECFHFHLRRFPLSAFNIQHLAFAFPPPAPVFFDPMFETIAAQLTTAAEKLAHLRRFL